jgi:hypothetical protein
MIFKTDIEKLSVQERQELLRDVFQTLPAKIQKFEAARLKRIVENKPVFIIETDDVSYRTYSVKGVQRIFLDLTGKVPDRSNIYKAVKQNRRKIYGINIKLVYEGDEQYGSTD